VRHAVGAWSEQVLVWYEIWRTSPQAKTFVMTDWMRLRMIAPLLEDYLNKPTAMKMAKIRQNESLLGATHTDRLKARIGPPEGSDQGGESGRGAGEWKRRRRHGTSRLPGSAYELIWTFL
jgi:hypothetical protein